MSDVPVIDNWKCSDANNGYLRSGNGPEESVDPLLGTTTVTTVVQVSGSGARTMVLPGRTKPSRERCLLVTVFALVILCGVCLLLLISKGQECTHPRGKCTITFISSFKVILFK